MIVAIASGKGGTGKTTVAVNLALSLTNAHLFDCDVEEPNAHTLLHPSQITNESVSVPIPVINNNECTLCGDCSDFCQFNALFVGKSNVLLYEKLCHSCGGCVIVCPAKAIGETDRRIGVIRTDSTGCVRLTYGVLDVGEHMAVPVIRTMKASVETDEVTIIDAPAGTSCAVIEAVEGSDYIILVAEPTPFGLHDLIMTIDVLDELSLPYGIVINKSGIGNDEIRAYLEEKKIPILMEIPFDRHIAELYSQGIPFVTRLPEYRSMFRSMLEYIEGVTSNGE